MKQVRTSLNNQQYQTFQKLCNELKESEYMFVKKAVEERMQKNGGLLAKAQKWLWEDHPIRKK